MVGLGGHWAGSIGSRRADASNRGSPGGLVIEGVTIGAGAGGYCFRVRGRFRGFCDQGGGVEGVRQGAGGAFNSHGSFRSCRKKALAASSAQSRRQKSQQIQTLMISLGQGEPERLD